MCGIAGLIGRFSEHRRICTEFASRLEHRGPDDIGYLMLTPQGVRLGREMPDIRSPIEASLVHRRLSIIDLSEGGWQPMGTADGRYYIVFNGEIYNYLELRRELEGQGHRFHSNSDTEVLLNAYAEWGPSVLQRLVGMFAFAVLDTRGRKLFLARDPFGIKPLYYCRWRDGLAFASEIRPLFLLPGVTRNVNPQRLYYYLRFGLTDHGDETMFADILQLPPAHYLEISLDRPDKVEPVCFWRPDISRSVGISFKDAANELRRLFLENVQLHMRSDVPVGACLSGGIDSSAIVMAMRYLQGNGGDLHTFSYIASGSEISEERWSDLVAGAAGTAVHKVGLHPEELLADLDRLVDVHGEPFGSTTIYAQYRVFQLAKEAGIKVMLDGQGADEMLGGYRFYLGARAVSLLRHGNWFDAVRFLNMASGLPGCGMAKLIYHSTGMLLPDWLQWQVRKMAGDDLMPGWLNKEWFQGRGITTRLPRRGRSPNVLREELRRTLIETSLPMLLRYEDRNSMAFSIESRVPFLTTEMVDFVLSLPEEYIIAADGTSKAVFREAMRGIIPGEVVERRDKLGFATPEQDWLAVLRPWVEMVLQSEAASRIPAIRLKVLEEEWRAVLGGRRRFDLRVWRWLNLIRWSELLEVQFR